MRDKPTGGPAFPLQSIGPDFVPGYAGMTLRDYFAAKAMPILWDAYDKGYYGRDRGVLFPDGFDNAILATGAYQMADAMLKAREQ